MFFKDTLNSGAGGASITTSPAQTGNTWTLGSGSTIVFDTGNGGVYSTTSGVDAWAYASGTNAAPTNLQATFNVLSDTGYSGFGFADAAGTHGYIVNTLNGSGLQLVGRVFGVSQSVLATYESGTPLSAGLHVVGMTQTVSGSTVTLNWSLDGVAIGSVLVSGAYAFTDCATVAVYFYGDNGQNATTGTHIEVASASSGGTIAATGSVTPPTASSQNPSFTFTDPLGDAPYSRQLYRAADNDVFTVTSGTAVSGANGLTPTDPSPTQALSAYRMTYTGASSATYYSPILLARQWPPPIIEGGIGESNLQATGVVGAGNEWFVTYDAAMAVMLRQRSFSYSNQAVSGSKTADWQPGGTYWNAAIAAFVAANVQYVHVQFGPNDFSPANATPAATYGSNLANIVNGLVALGYTVILHYFTIPLIGGSLGDTAASLVLAFSYLPYIDSLINGSTILRGTTECLEYFYNPAYLESDETHWNLAGQVKFANMVLQARAAILTVQGDGATATMLTITSDGSTPVSSARVSLTSDAAGQVPVGGPLITNSSGQTTFNLTTGTTYYLTALKQGSPEKILDAQAFTA